MVGEIVSAAVLRRCDRTVAMLSCWMSALERKRARIGSEYGRVKVVGNAGLVALLGGR
jgi:hypothetical protein